MTDKKESTKETKIEYIGRLRKHTHALSVSITDFGEFWIGRNTSFWISRRLDSPRVIKTDKKIRGN